jgi:signal transduction histidine kinase
VTPNDSRRSVAGRWSPRLYILGIVGLLLVPLLLTALSVQRGAEAAESRVRSDRLARALLTAQTVSSFIDTQFVALQSLARSPDVRDLGNRPDIRGVLEQALADTPDWESIEVFQEDGWSVVGVGPGVRQINIADRPYFHEGLATDHPIIGPAAPGRRGLVQSVPLIAPVQFVTGANGVLIAWLSTDRLEEALATTARDSDVHIAVVDARGSIFARSGPDALLPVVPAGAEWSINAALTGVAGVTEVQSADNPSMLVAHAPVPSAPWAVVVTQRTAAAYGEIRDQRRDELLLLGITAVVIALLAFHLGNRLTRAYDRQIEAVGRVDAFVAAASHDLKTPLTAVKTLAQLLQRRLARTDRADAPWLSDGLAEIDTATNRMTRQINELLDAARFQRGAGLELQRRPTDLVALTRRVADEQQKTTEHHRIRVGSSSEKLIGPWDEERLERVVANLIGNAIKYSPGGGEIDITLCRESGALPGAWKRGDDRATEWALLIVQDRGLGIPSKDLPHIFERFHRGRNVAETISGTGIGLAGAKQIVEQHGGTITAVSSEGAGSTFTVRLPLTHTPTSPRR